MRMLKREGLWREKDGEIYSGPINQGSPHPCCFTQLRRRKFIAEGWCQLVGFLGGNESSGDALQAVLTKQGDYDPIIAKQMLRIYVERGRALGLKWGPINGAINGPIYGFYGSNWTDQEKEDFRLEAVERATEDGFYGSNWTDQENEDFRASTSAAAAAKTPEDRAEYSGRMSAAVTVAMVASHAEWSSEERAEKCLSGLVMPLEAACIRALPDGSVCGAELAGIVKITQHGTKRLYTSTLCTALHDGKRCGRVDFTTPSRLQEVCETVPKRVLSEKKLEAAKVAFSKRELRARRRWTVDEKVGVRLGYTVFGKSPVSIVALIFLHEVTADVSHITSFCTQQLAKMSEPSLTILGNMKGARLPLSIFKVRAGIFTVDRARLKKLTSARQYKALFEGLK